MFQCIIQHRNGLIYNAPELKHVFPGNNFMTVIKSICKGNGQEQNFCILVFIFLNAKSNYLQFTKYPYDV